MEWFEELDFDENPFTTDPREFTQSLVAVEELKDEMYYRINAGSLLVIEGPTGHGKTSLLMLAAHKFGGNRNVAYVNCALLDKELNITNVLQDKYGMMGKLLKKKPKNMIVLLDDVEELDRLNTERLKYYYDQNYIRSIIFATSDYKKAKFTDSLRDRIGNRIMKLPTLDEYDAVELIRNRIEDSELFNDEIIKKVFKLSSGSPKLLLENCEQLAQHAVEKERNRVQMADLSILGKENE